MTFGTVTLRIYTSSLFLYMEPLTATKPLRITAHSIGNGAVYKELYLGKYISHLSTVKECDYRSVALASIRSFAVVRIRTVPTHVY